MIEQLSDNDKAALAWLVKYCFYHNWHKFLLLNYAVAGEQIEYGDLNHDMVFEINDVLVEALIYLKRWYDGIDITDTEIDGAFYSNNSTDLRQERGVLTVSRKLLCYASELQSIVDPTNESTKIENIIKRIQRCFLLIELWYAGEDLTYFGTMLD
jgi:hypothetical protein